ncbi:nuclease SbcCD subunit C [Geotalea uraniireducens]|uniref:Nuclease SbcCD subunit C n=1 Tax=Geotalea uraniireducens TaxID=351604 RepID=A0ABM8ELX4_9BACT|nr:AAA family ATPase [Geotalea uraniireducens]BDV43550.1 nuclease SbcCD subunit C [Geotalea uraniireducens]
MLWISGLHLPAFGRFRGADLVFQPGMNLVYGRNEAGKSTILAAIAGTIFGIRRDKERYVPWDGGERCEAQVSFVYDGREMTIWRDFLTDRVRAVERRDGEALWRFEGKVSPAGRSSEREEYLAKIEEIWGFAEGDIFRNSIHVGQQDLKIEEDHGLATRIKQLLSGYAELDYDAVVDSLEKELYELTRRPGGRAKDRELELVRTRIAELATAWREGSRVLAEIATLESAVGELRSAVAAGRADLDKGAKYLQRVKIYLEATAQEEQLKRGYDRLETERTKLETLLARKEAIVARLAALGPASELTDDDVRTVEAYLADVERLDRAEEALAALGPAPAAPRLVTPFLLVLLGCWLGAIMGWFLLPAAGYALAITALVLTVGYGLRAGRDRRRLEAAALRRQGHADGLATEVGRLRTTVAHVAAELSARAGVAAPDNARELLAALAHVAAARSELASVTGALAVLPTHEEALGRIGEVARELAIVRATAAEVAGKGFPVISHEEFVAAEEKMRRLEGEVREQERSCQLQEQQLAILAQKRIDLEAIEDEGEELKNREVRLVRRIGALQLAVEVLRETLDEYRATYLARLNGEINGKLYNLTAGRYRDAALDDRFNLTIGADGGGRPVEHYSCGVRDQGYLAARLALGSILSRGRKLPFLLDDPLVNFDDERKTAALTALSLGSREHQVILFVHDERYLRLRGADQWHKIRLDQKGKQDGQLHLL